jgi:UDP-glucose 4-epimerase
MGDYYRVPADNRDLNYGKYFTQGEERVSAQIDYNSHNVPLKSVEEMMVLLQKLECVRQAMAGEKIEA